MPTADDVIVEFEAKVGGYIADLNRARSTFERTTGQQVAAANRMQQGVSRAFGVAGRAALGFISALGAAGAVREFLRIADAAKQVEAQLRLSTRETGSFAQAQADVRRIATETRTSLEAAAQLYATFQRNSVELGISQEQSARATETVTKAFRISGATAAEAAGGLRQFLQGLQSGALRGEELNSVLENAPRLAKLLADGLGVTVGQLRALGQEGDLAADKLIRALTDRKFTEGIDAEFRELPITFGEAMQQVENAAIVTFGAFDRGGQFSTALANFITDGTNGFADLEQAAVDTGVDIRSTFEGLANVFQPLLEAGREVFALLESDAVTLADRIRPLLGQIDRLTSNARTNFWDNVLPGEQARLPGTNLLERFNAGQRQSEANLRNRMGEQWLTDFFRGYDVMGNPIAPSGRPGGAASSGGKGGGAAAQRRAQTEARQAENRRRQAIQDEASKQAEIARMQDDILAARTALARASEDVLQFELQQIESEKAQRLAQFQTEVRLGDLTQKEYEDRAALIEQAAQLQKQGLLLEKAERDAEDQLDRQRDALRQANDQLALESDALLARADIADTLEKRRFLENSALALQQEIERALLEQAIAEGKVADAAAARAALGERQAAEMEGLRRSNQGALGRYLDSTSDPAALAEEAAVRELQAVRDGLAEGLAEQLGVKNDFVKSMLSIFLDQVIFRPLAEAFRDNGGGGGLLGAIVTTAGAFFGGGRAIGGPVRAGTPYMVGESGRELFVPQQNGVVVPNHRLNAQGTAPIVNQTFVLDARGGITTPELLEYVNGTARRAANEAGARSYQQAMQDAPARVQSAQRYGR